MGTTNQFFIGCGCMDEVTPCNTVFLPVDKLPDVYDATRNHAYVLPNNTVWTLNSEGTEFVQLNGGEQGEPYDDTEVKNRLTALENRPDKDTTYKAGENIDISDDGTISANVTQQLIEKVQHSEHGSTRTYTLSFENWVSPTDPDDIGHRQLEIRGGFGNVHLDFTTSYTMADKINNGGGVALRFPSDIPKIKSILNEVMSWDGKFNVYFNAENNEVNIFKNQSGRNATPVEIDTRYVFNIPVFTA